MTTIARTRRSPPPSTDFPVPGGQAGNLTTFTAATLSAALLGGLLAFLFFNWAPAKVFMGDGASGFLGFSFAALPLLVAEPTPVDLWLKLNLGALAWIIHEFRSEPSRAQFRRGFVAGFRVRLG